jgi:hypothetical protein
MNKREQLQRMVVERLERYEECGIDARMFQEMLDDPNDKPVGAFGVSMNEAIALAGGRPGKNQHELFEAWCIDSGIEWHEGFHEVTLRKSEQERMRDFLLQVAAKALRWKDVESVEIGLHLSNRFENDGWDGRVYLRLLGGQHFGYEFASYALKQSRNPDMLIDDMRRRFELARIQAEKAR